MDGTRGDDVGFSLVRGGPIYKLLVRLRVIPPGGLGIGRRILLFWALTVVPILFLALAAGQLVPAAGFRDALARHFSVFVRLILTIPIFVGTEIIVERFAAIIGPQLRSTGLLTEEEVPHFRRIVHRAERLRDSRIAFALIAAAAAAAVYNRLDAPSEWHELSWAMLVRGGRPVLSAAGYWYAIGGYGSFLLLGFQWLWRIAIMFVLYRGIAGLNLSLVPTHPDRAGGLGFLQRTYLVFSPVAFAVSAVLSARWSYDMVYRGFHLGMLQTSIVAFIIIAVLVLIAPMFVFFPVLVRLRRDSLLEYSPFVSRHGRMVRRKWVRGETIPPEESGVLKAPELGPLIDVYNLYMGIQAIMLVPINPRALVALVIIIGIPILPVLMLEIPLKEILSVLGRSL